MKNHGLLILAMAFAICLLPACSPSAGGDGDGTITMPESSEEYCAGDWTLQGLEDHFRDLGFSEFEKNPVEPEDDDYMKNIYELEIQPGLVFDGPWERGDQFRPDAKIVIYYNESPMMTIEDCPDLGEMLEGSEEYIQFAEKYDGRYLSFEAYVSSQHEYISENDLLTEVSGSDYEYNQSHGMAIRIGNKSWESVINEVPVGTRVHVEGYVDLDWSKYWDQLYIEGIRLYAA